MPGKPMAMQSVSSIYNPSNPLFDKPTVPTPYCTSVLLIEQQRRLLLLNIQPNQSINNLKDPARTSTLGRLLLYPIDVLPTNRIPRRHVLLHAGSEAGSLAARQ
jgi:hypothetical protein